MNHTTRVLHADRRSAGAAREAEITRRAGGFLRRVAGDLRLRAGEHDITAQAGACGHGCRVTLNTDRLIVEVADAPIRNTVAVSFRTRRGRSDLSGGGDNSVSLEQISSREGYEAMISSLRLANGLDGERR
jgi:hypothetical protein